jgi:cellulose synthase/poly-beta-1,6-N-acetylglucosamine synthase-like glycosyltransferase
MIWAFWISAALIAYILVGWPVLVALWSRLFPNPIRKEFTPRTATVILAVNNGEQYLRGKLDSLLSLDYPREMLDVIVVSDGSTDSTDAIVEQCSMRDPRVQLVRVPRGGKCSAINAGVARATGEILFFTDVRQELDPACLRYMVACYADPRVGVASGGLRIRDSNSKGEQAVGLYWRFEIWIRDHLSDIDSIFGATGAIYTIRRELAVPLPAEALLDDMYLPLAAFFKGYRLVVERKAIAWDVPTNLDEEFVRKVRTLGGVYQVMGYYPQLLGPGNRMWLHYISYKFGRLVLPYLMLMFVAACVLTPGPIPKACLGGSIAVCLLAGVDRWVPQGFALKRLSATAKTFVSLLAASALAVRVFFVDPRSLWVITRPKKEMGL